MKTTLPIQSRDFLDTIDKITEIIVKTASDKIAMVILFGSFARGNWVYDRYVREGITYCYASDFDILIATKNKKDGNSYSAINLRNKIEKAIDKSGLNEIAHKVHIIIEPIHHINSELEKSQYFFSDIKHEGILLYDSKEFKLSKPRQLSNNERKKIAIDDYNQWFNKAEYFLKHFYFDIENGIFKESAFQLHQATESLYNCALLVLTGYKPKSHNLIELGRLAASKSNKFLTVFPKATKEQIECFDLLRTAYSDSRYEKSYVITKAQLEYLMQRVEELKKIVKEVCKKNIENI